MDNIDNLFANLIKRSKEKAAMPEGERRLLEARETFARNAIHVVRDEASRDEHSLEHRVVVLGTHADTRHLENFKDASGERRSDNALQLAYRDDGLPIDGREGMKTVIHFESEADRLTQENGGIDRIDDVARAADAGVTVSMLGRDVERSWRKSDDTWHKTTEFHAQRIAIGTVSREELMAREPGGLVEASERYVAAEGPEAKEAIARAHLRQEPAKEAGSVVRGITKGPVSAVDQDMLVARVGRDSNGR